MRPIISVIIACHGEHESLERGICSVLDQPGQTFALELGVVDGGANDASRAVVERYREALAWTLQLEHTGPAEALNAALTHCTGELVMVLPGDAVLLPGALAQAAELWHQTRAQSAAANTKPELFWLVGGCQHLGERGEVVAQLDATRPRDLLSFLRHDNGLLPLAASVFERRIFDELGGFDPHLPLAFDYELAARLLGAGVRLRITGLVLAAQREPCDATRPDEIVRKGEALIVAAERFAAKLSLRDRYDLWRNCEQRRKIYALASAELHDHESHRRLWHDALCHPWWLADVHFRDRLLHRRGDDQPGAVPADDSPSNREAA
jgi:glycosyltransferase involved in cell wall biosynthesis